MLTFLPEMMESTHLDRNFKSFGSFQSSELSECTRFLEVGFISETRNFSNDGISVRLPFKSHSDSIFDKIWNILIKWMTIQEADIIRKMIVAQYSQWHTNLRSDYSCQFIRSPITSDQVIITPISIIGLQQINFLGRKFFRNILSLGSVFDL